MRPNDLINPVQNVLSHRYIEQGLTGTAKTNTQLACSFDESGDLITTRVVDTEASVQVLIRE